MSKKALQRIISRDIKSIQKNKLSDSGIHIHFDEGNMLNAVAMIIGPKDSVYHNGVLLFKISFPTNYPYSPPKVSYIARNSIRIHPNLYTGSAKDEYLGKVCISLLNTWSGPQWTSIMDISSIMLSILSLLDNNPLSNEPGFSDKITTNHLLYAESVSYERFRTLIVKNICDIPDEFLCFKDIIMEHYVRNRDIILSELNTKIYESKYNNSVININVYRINILLAYSSIKDKLNKFDLKI